MTSRMIVATSAAARVKSPNIRQTPGFAEAKNLPSFVTQQIHYTLEAPEAGYELLPLSVD